VCATESWKRRLSVRRTFICKEQAMLDAALIALGLGFFALSIGYAIYCDRI
jgi:hypothetical protein